MFREVYLVFGLLAGAWGVHDCTPMGSLLTYYINGINGPCWPGFLPFIVIPEITDGMLTEGFSEDRYISGDEVATFIEVAGAYFKDGMTIGDLGPQHLLLVETIHIDMTEKAATNANYEVTVEDIEEWICENGPIPPRAFIIINTGWSYKRGTRYYGPESTIDMEDLNANLNYVLDEMGFLVPYLLEFTWPGISAKAAKYLTECFFIVGIGIDTPSLDAGKYFNPYASDIPDGRLVRRLLTSHGLYLVHNILLLDIHLPARGIFATLGVFNMCKATRAPVNLYVEFCIDTSPSLYCRAEDYRNVIFGTFPHHHHWPRFSSWG